MKETIRNRTAEPSDPSQRMEQRLPTYLKTGLEAARAAGDTLLDWRGRVSIQHKADHADLVTEADREAETIIMNMLRTAFPDHECLGEETGAHAGQAASGTTGSGYRWIIDPLDGTTNYAQGLPLFATSIGLEKDGHLLVGVIHAPALGATYSALRGGGAFYNGEPMRVSDTPHVKDSLLVTGFIHDEDVIRTNVERMPALIRSSRGVRSLGSAALNLAYVAQGVFEAYWAPANQPWDVAGGALIVQEAGGKITDMNGDPLDIFRPRLLATNGHVHEEMLQALQPI